MYAHMSAWHTKTILDRNLFFRRTVQTGNDKNFRCLSSVSIYAILKTTFKELGFKNFSDTFLMEPNEKMAISACCYRLLMF
jgi:hypothetical protein